MLLWEEEETERKGKEENGLFSAKRSWKGREEVVVAGTTHRNVHTRVQDQLGKRRRGEEERREEEREEVEGYF